MSALSQLLFPLRRCLEYCSRHVVFTRRLPRRFGSLPLMVSPAASLIYYRGLNRPNFDDLYDFNFFFNVIYHHFNKCINNHTHNPSCNGGYVRSRTERFIAV